MDAVTIDRAVILEAELLPEAGGDEQVAHAGLDALRPLPDLLAQGQVLNKLTQVPLGRAVKRIDTQLVHVPAERANVGRDRHRVIVQDNDELARVQVSGVVHGFERHACRHRPISDDGNRVVVLAGDVAGNSHPDGRGVGGARVARTEGVVVALPAVSEPGKPPELADRRHPLLAAREDLVDVHLVTDVPDDLVFWRIKQAVQRYVKLDHSEVGCEMAAPADAIDGIDEEPADFP
jgi:hypothetical protein